MMVKLRFGDSNLKDRNDIIITVKSERVNLLRRIKFTLQNKRIQY